VAARFTPRQIRAHGLANLHRWRQSGSWVPAYDEWQRILTAAPDGELFAVMLGRDECSDQLRQSPPLRRAAGERRGTPATIAKYVARRQKDLIFIRELVRRGIIERKRMLELVELTPVDRKLRERIRLDYRCRLRLPVARGRAADPRLPALA
jgi:hypothetical protein